MTKFYIVKNKTWETNFVATRDYCTLRIKFFTNMVLGLTVNSKTIKLKLFYE